MKAWQSISEMAPSDCVSHRPYMCACVIGRLSIGSSTFDHAMMEGQIYSPARPTPPTMSTLFVAWCSMRYHLMVRYKFAALRVWCGFSAIFFTLNPNEWSSTLTLKLCVLTTRRYETSLSGCPMRKWHRCTGVSKGAGRCISC